ncbi:ABC-type sugar transport system ATPase subunit [Ereboglobus sp. PH5-10]|uniref:ATP-binding cassette domain-containing protein n=1 Tax=Ereboglobus sp. PH5-10 TaxID=2940629 RepID=UPI0024050268|nr:ABC transporter ATP-binding protein [Ereboglobus sp. PH5-10]MDF9827764.1 ABC-type sugar transport system ATPase subunit [Ereboglobus sp. PH5-10]
MPEQVSKTFLTVEGVTIRYEGGLQLFPEMNFSANKGELIGILGPSGVGKSSLLRVIAGLQAASTGNVKVDGRCVTKARPKDRGVSMLFQDPVIYEHMSVFENIAFPLYCQNNSLNVINESVHKIAKLLEISELLTVSPKRLSGGERQRLALARVFASNSRCALLDEPVKAAFEPAMRAAIRRHIRDLHLVRGGVTVIVSHEHQEIVEICDRLLFIFPDGSYCISPEEAIAHPPNESVARFMDIGNIVSAQLDQETECLILDSGMRLKLSTPVGQKNIWNDNHKHIWYIPPNALTAKKGITFHIETLAWTAIGPIVTLCSKSTNSIIKLKMSGSMEMKYKAIEIFVDGRKIKKIG